MTSTSMPELVSGKQNGGIFSPKAMLTSADCASSGQAQAQASTSRRPSDLKMKFENMASPAEISLPQFALGGNVPMPKYVSHRNVQSADSLRPTMPPTIMAMQVRRATLAG